MRNFEEFMKTSADKYSKKTENTIQEILSKHELNTKEDIVNASVLIASILTDYRMHQYHEWLSRYYQV